MIEGNNIRILELSFDELRQRDAVSAEKHECGIDQRKCADYAARQSFTLQSHPWEGGIDSFEIAVGIKFASKIEMVESSNYGLYDSHFGVAG
jgi:hypothetical protein